jgi:hypothetical protein
MLSSRVNLKADGQTCVVCRSPMSIRPYKLRSAFADKLARPYDLAAGTAKPSLSAGIVTYLSAVKSTVLHRYKIPKTKLGLFRKSPHNPPTLSLQSPPARSQIRENREICESFVFDPCPSAFIRGQVFFSVSHAAHSSSFFQLAHSRPNVSAAFAAPSNKTTVTYQELALFRKNPVCIRGPRWGSAGAAQA